MTPSAGMRTSARLCIELQSNCIEKPKEAEFQRVRERGLDRNVGQGLAIKLDSYGSWQSQNSHALDKAGRCEG